MLMQGQQIQSVSCGSEHSIVATDQGKVSTANGDPDSPPPPPPPPPPRPGTPRRIAE